MTLEFVQLLRRLDPEITASEIADVVWLACRINSANTAESGPAGAESEPGEFPEATTSPPEDDSLPKKDTDSLQCRAARLFPRTSRGTHRSDGPGAHSIQSPGVPALPGRLDIARSFRPLKKRTESRRRREIDVRATADRMADTGIHWPVLRPVQERWLDLSFVVEVSRTMVIWRGLVRELRKLLHRTGVFRKIAGWEFGSDRNHEQIILHRGDGINRPYRSVVGVEGRRLVLVVSDCISGIWRNGSAARLMDHWGDDAMTALVQLFPEHLWSRTALRQASSVRLRMQSPGSPNRSLQVSMPPDWVDPLPLENEDGDAWQAPEGPKIPVFPLEPAYIRAWAASLAGLRYFDLPGVVLDRNPTFLAAGKPDIAERPSAEILVERFTAVSSPTARRLAGYLAAAPLVMPVIRLVQAVMLPDSRQTHLAEVMLSGLIRRVTPEGAVVAEDEVLYDFADGVRERLLAMNRISESMKVLELAMGRMRDFLDARTGRPLNSFRALIADPSSLGEIRLARNDRAFAEISVFVLKRLGGRYAEIAAKLEKIVAARPNEYTASLQGQLPDVEASLEGKTTPTHGDIHEIRIGKEKIPMRFVYIEPGEFMMGSPKDEPERYDDEKQHMVILTKGFYMQETPVTQEQWMAVMGKNPSHFKEGGPECPVESVSWEDAQKFLKRLNEKSGDVDYRLPTEAQWEYACRAGTTTPFWTGRCLSTDEANYDGNYPLEGCPKGIYREKTTPVKTFSPNPWGLYDMHGNVREWCSDWFGDYPDGTVTDPTGLETGALRVYRGGSWSDHARYCRSAYRDNYTPDSRIIFLGFRVVAVQSG